MTDDHTVLVDDVRWVLTPAGRNALSNEDLRLKSDRATVVKHGQHRTVYRVELPSGAVYWKHCRLNGPRAWWRDVFRGPKAKLEFDRARELAGRGIATVEPLAWGRFDRRRPGGSFLVTRALADTIPLDEYLVLHPPESAKERRALAVALAEFVAQLHAAGVTHPDLHPGNLLVRPAAGGLQFFLIDVHDLVLGTPLDRRERVTNLTLLNRWFFLRVGRTDRLRFWRAYAGAGTAAEEPLLVERETERSVARLWESRGVRCLRENRHFRRVHSPVASGYCVRETDEKLLAELAADPDAPFRRPDAVLLKDSRSATVCVISVPTPTGSRAMVYKRFRVTKWTDPLADLVRPSAALRSWMNGHAFLDRGLPTPRPWLFLHRRPFGFSTTGYLLCDQVADACNLHDAIRALDHDRKQRLIDTLARWVRLMHDRGVSHRDLKAANILVTSAGEVQFIDLVGVRTLREVGQRLRIRDLTRLNASFVNSLFVTLADRKRFLSTYLLWGLRKRKGWGDWWKEIRQGTEAKVRLNAQRNRPLA